MIQILKKLLPRRRIKIGSRVRATQEIEYHLSDFPQPYGMFDCVSVGQETLIQKVCGKINGERTYLVTWGPSHFSPHKNPAHIVRRSQIELVA
jgi:hypothetical protein